jgi:hypothetical protein
MYTEEEVKNYIKQLVSQRQYLYKQFKKFPFGNGFIRDKLIGIKQELIDYRDTLKQMKSS